jgi:hypothetical protein
MGDGMTRTDRVIAILYRHQAGPTVMAYLHGIPPLWARLCVLSRPALEQAQPSHGKTLTAALPFPYSEG